MIDSHSPSAAADAHVDDVVLLRLFHKGAQPLDAEEFDSLNRHLDRCANCRRRFAQERDRARIGKEPLTEGQVETILNVVRQKAAATASERVPMPVSAGRSHAWGRRFIFGLTAVGVAAGIILLTGKPRMQGDHRAPFEKLTPKGSRSLPFREIRCFDEGARILLPMTQPTGYCRVGSKPTIHAKEVEGFPWVSAIVCSHGDAWVCELVGSAKHSPDARDVNIDGPPMQVGQRLRIFTIWSRDAITPRDVEDASMTLRSQKANPDATERLPIKDSKQLAHTAVAGDPPS